MHLKKLELSGFKSFAKKTSLDFPHGITVIAGPNGSGKSNVVDAIRWALAEQGLKNLRGKKGEDLIFYGSQLRGSLARASVAMHFDMDRENNPLGFSETVIAREVDKSGENTYLLNGRRVRLTDFEGFLAQSRVGDSSFRIISQGMSDKLLNLSPKEFRAFVEEAAGVKEYQDKKYQASLRLKNTRENLDKVGVILVELKPQLKILKKEKDKLEKKETYLGELKECAQEFFGLKHREILNWGNKLAEKRKNIKLALKPLSEEIKNLRESIFSLDKKTSLNSELAVLASEMRKLEKDENELTRKIISAEGRINLEEEKGKQLLPVSVEYLKGKIGELVNKLSVDFKGMDVETLRQVMASAAVALRDLLKIMEPGLNPAAGGDTIPLLKQGLEKLLTVREEIGLKLREMNPLIAQKEKILMDERHVSLAKEKVYRARESELYNLENSLRQTELDEEKLKLHQAKFQQDMAAVGVVTLAEIIGYRPESTKMVLASSKVLGDPSAVSTSSTQASSGQFTAGELEERVWKLKRRLEEVGSIDGKVIREYEGVNERFNFLTKESDDLTQTLTSLEDLVKGLEREVSKCYKTTLAEMSHVFGGYFRLIFGGGKATLAEAATKSQISNLKSQKLESDPENVSDDQEISGVEIKLELPNKKVKSLSTLSGGERTLSSIALLFALASIRKPPVMVLDEIDAALDEPNTQKFVRLLKELSQNTQFIVVTHNRETMRHADALYGVSMKDGISHLLSLKLQSV